MELVKVVPVPKKDKGQDIKDNKPISLLQVPTKIFELILHSDIFSHVRHYISSQQHGFHSSQSIKTNLVNFTQYVLGERDRDAQVDANTQIFKKRLTR